jgi:glycosyltransferase involved in cell wall biosynthesis
LFLPRWYPNRLDPMPGLFIRRHAEALAKTHLVTVLSVHPDPACASSAEVVFSTENNVRTCRVYYKVRTCGPSSLRKISAAIGYLRAHFKGFRALGEYRPDIIHGHILTREILFAFYLSRKWQVPYLISEHWSRYFPENGTYRGMMRKCITRFLVRNSAGITAVSGSLKKAMTGCGLDHQRFYIVPNSIDLSVFVSVKSRGQGNAPTILHVSCFEDKSKNIRGFLKAVSGVLSRKKDVKALLVGEGPDFAEMKTYATRLGIDPERISFAGLKEGPALAQIYQNSSFLVQSSRYETFGTVVIEALSCGLPVISTNTGVAGEILAPALGILIQHSAVDEISAAIDRMLDIYTTFDKDMLHHFISVTYSDQAIAGQLTEIYQEILSQCQTG